MQNRFDCPGCGKDLNYHVDAARGMPDNPKPGDMIVCATCGTVAEVEPDGAHVHVLTNTHEEYPAIMKLLASLSN